MRRAALMTLALLAQACAGAPDRSRVWVHDLSIVGIRHVNEKALRAALMTQRSRGGSSSGKQPFDAFAFRLDAQRIERFYQMRGFFDAHVVSTSIRPAARGKAVDVEIDIDEGPATKLRTAKLEGIDTLGEQAQDVAKRFHLKKGQLFDHASYLADRVELVGRLRDLGYPWATIDGDAIVDRDHHVADITLRVTPGALARIGRVIIVGTKAVRGDLLARHAGLRPGALATSDLLESAHSSLYNLRLFSSVKLELKHSTEHDELADVLVSVQEAPLHEWRVGFGLSLDQQRTEVRGRVLYDQRYLFHGLREIHLRFEPAYTALPAFWNPLRHGPAATLEAQFSQLDLIRAPDELRLTVAYDLGIEYAFAYHGPRAQLAYSRKLWRDRLQLGLSYNFNQLLFFKTDPALLVDEAEAARRYGYVDPYRLAWLAEEATLDLRDRPFDTRRGAYFAARVEEGGVYTGSRFTYEKLETEARGYLPLGSRVVVAARTSFGHIFVHGDTGSPTTRRFYLGGQDSHRGFNYNRLSSQIVSGLPGTPSLPIGGDQMFLTQVELRIHAVRLLGYWMQIAAFVDAGDVAAPTGSPKDRLDLSRLHYAVGGGLRYQTIIGTLRADVGVRLNRLRPFEDDGTANPDPGHRVAIHLSIGEPF